MHPKKGENGVWSWVNQVFYQVLTGFFQFKEFAPKRHNAHLSLFSSQLAHPIAVQTGAVHQPITLKTPCSGHYAPLVARSQHLGHPGVGYDFPPGHPHRATAEGETVIQINGEGPFAVTYLDPADDPRGQTN